MAGFTVKILLHGASGSLSSLLVRHEESKLWIADRSKNELLEIDIDSTQNNYHAETILNTTR